jgi:magnesium transporter
MIEIHGRTGSIKAAAGEIPKDAIWIDMIDPDERERDAVSKHIGVRLPTREQLSEIEESSRVSKRDDHLYLSTPIIGNSTMEDAEISPAGFVLGAKLVVTIRYAELPTFDLVAERLTQEAALDTPLGIFVALLEAIIDRGADVLEHLGVAADEISKNVFRGDLSTRRIRSQTSVGLRRALSKLGALGDRLSKARDVLLGVGRIASFTADVGHDWLSQEFHDRLKAVSKDVESLSAYESHLSDKTQFLLDAILGYISIEQNDIFRVLTIASVVGVPPTLMAGVWGMNFKFMPELNWTFGYPFAWGVIILTMILPLVWFWRRGWF